MQVCDEQHFNSPVCVCVSVCVKRVIISVFQDVHLVIYDIFRVYKSACQACNQQYFGSSGCTPVRAKLVINNISAV